MRIYCQPISSSEARAFGIMTKFEVALGDVAIGRHQFLWVSFALE